MPCDFKLLENVPLFALLDHDELSVLASQVEVKQFAARQRIYKIGDPGGRAYVVISGKARVTTVDEDHQELVVDEPSTGDFFGFASLLDMTPHQTNAVAEEVTQVIEIDRDDLARLIERKPAAGLDMLAVLGKHFHTANTLARSRSMRNANQIIEQESTFGERIADEVARFGGSWRFIITFGGTLLAYVAVNQILGRSAWDPYPYILLNLFLSMLAAIQAPVIMMSQNRQDTKDRLRSELDFEVNRRAESEIQSLSSSMRRMQDKLDDLEDLLRQNPH